MPIIRIQTTQNVTVEYEVASIGDRMLATLIDWAMYVAYLGIVIVVISQTNSIPGNIGSLLIYLPVLLYPLACEVFFEGRTLGKHARDLKVVKASGAQPVLGDFLLRWLLIPVDVMTGAIGVLVMLVTANVQRLGDLAAGTVVVKLRAGAGLRASTFAATDAASNYQVTFPQAAQLSDRDAAIIRQLLTEGLRRGDENLLRQTVERVQAIIGIGPVQQPIPWFLGTLLRDHAHLAAQEETR
jgi:uncharacterized RDD family membrane protein YckC